MQERDAISKRNIPYDVAAPTLAGQLHTYDPTTNTYKLVTPLAGTKIYYVSDTPGGATTRKLTLQNGVLISEI